MPPTVQGAVAPASLFIRHYFHLFPVFPASPFGLTSHFKMCSAYFPLSFYTLVTRSFRLAIVWRRC